MRLFERIQTSQFARTGTSVCAPVAQSTASYYRQSPQTLPHDHPTGSQRNTEYGRLYIPSKAHFCARMRLHDQRGLAPLKNERIYVFVREKLLQGWSPEIIAGRLPLEYPGQSIHHETIYRYIYDRGAGLHLWKYLTQRRNRRMQRYGRRVKRCGKIPGAVSIDERPAAVMGREEAGHWETDNLIGKQTDRHAISTTVERVTRYTMLSKVSKTAQAKQEALVARLLPVSAKLKKTITTDNGGENMHHTEITSELSMAMYFCHAYHSWEKGTVENMNGRIRRFIPKGKRIDLLTDAEVSAVEYQLNATPRKCLGFLTPAEAFAIESGTLLTFRASP